MIKGLREKFRKNEKGFTLIEMLIVVAIIAILIAVSIPLVGTALERARKATDMANQRSAIAVAEIMYLSGEKDAGTYPYIVTGSSGTLGATGGTTDGYGQCSDHKGGYINVTIDEDGKATCKWAAPTGTTVTEAPDTSTTPTADPETP